MVRPVTEQTALDQFRSLTPDVAIVDLRMRPMDGVQLTHAMRESEPNARVILLTTYDTDEEIFRGLRAGASSYLLKDVDSARLAETIRAVHAGRKEIPPEIAAKLADHVASETLTPRQEEVLRGVAEGKSNLEIAKALFVSEGTVKAHVKAILQKLGARDRTQAITIAIDADSSGRSEPPALAEQSRQARACRIDDPGVRISGRRGRFVSWRSPLLLPRGE